VKKCKCYSPSPETLWMTIVLQKKTLLNRLTSIVWEHSTLRCERFRVQFPAMARFFCLLFCFVVVIFLSKKHHLHISGNSFLQCVCNVKSYSILIILQHLWSIIRVSRYRRSIFWKKKEKQAKQRNKIPNLFLYYIIMYVIA